MNDRDREDLLKLAEIVYRLLVGLPAPGDAAACWLIIDGIRQSLALPPPHPGDTQ